GWRQAHVLLRLHARQPSPSFPGSDPAAVRRWTDRRHHSQLRTSRRHLLIPPSVRPSAFVGFHFSGTECRMRVATAATRRRSLLVLQRWLPEMGKNVAGFRDLCLLRRKETLSRSFRKETGQIGPSEIRSRRKEAMSEHLNVSRRALLAGAAIAGTIAPIVAAAPAQAQRAPAPAKAAAKVDISTLPRRKVELVAPPFVHKHTQKAVGGPAIVEFTMTIQEKKIVIDDEGTEVHAMTFNGSVPGPLMVVHQDDYVELTLINPETNTLMHNIDFHPAAGALGGAGLTEVNPGEKTVLRWKATKAGVFVYHCAPSGMVPWHVTSGMNGAIMVLRSEERRVGKGCRVGR